jgi:aralkylamine N-acetyltransferase
MSDGYSATKYSYNLEEPMIQYQADLNGVSWNRISELMEAVGWDQRCPEELRQAFGKSTYVRIAYDGNKIIGFGRTVDDGRYYGMIVDLVVDPEFQGRGIGSKILRELQEEMTGYKIISLRAAPGMQDFYLKQGWKKSKSAFHPDRQEQ